MISSLDMKNALPYRRRWMLAGFAAAFLIGDMFLAVREAATTSFEFLYGVAGFSLAQLFWTIGQLHEARPDARVFLAAAFPLAAFVLCRLHPPVLPAAATGAVCVYSVLTALSLATALATRRVFYICGIWLLLFSDLMIGGGLVRMPGCNAMIGPVYIAAEACLLVSFFWGGEWRVARERIGIRWSALTLGAVGFACFFVAMSLYPGGGYNPLLKMLSALGESKVRGVAYPTCHRWFVAGMFLSAASVAGVWVRLVRMIGGGWRSVLVGWGGAMNVAGLCTIALVPFDVNGTVHNVGCYLATFGGAAILFALFRKGADLAWTVWFVVLVIVFVLCLDLKAIPFSPYVTTTQKFLIVSFAVWAAWLAWRMGGNAVGARSVGSVSDED